MVVIKLVGLVVDCILYIFFFRREERFFVFVKLLLWFIRLFIIFSVLFRRRLFFRLLIEFNFKELFFVLLLYFK